MRRITLLALVAVLVSSPVLAQAPVYAGIWSDKEPGGVGGLFYDMSWEGLASRWKELGAKNQYLAHVEAYEKDGQVRYAAVWRIGKGNGALWAGPWPEFAKRWTEWKKVQDLIDIEVYETGGTRMYLGVFRHKQGSSGDGGLLAGLTWQQLVDKRKEFADKAYLSDVETYVDDGVRKFVGVWQVGKGAGALYWMKDWPEFVELKQRLNKSQEMLDFEMFQTDGKWNFLGVWRMSERAGPLHASASNAKFEPLTAAQIVARWEKLQETATLVGLAAVVPEPPPLTSLRGDTTCKYGDPDCNRCATDVEAQFRLAFETGHRPWIGWDARSWTFRGDSKYAPDGLKPETAFWPYDGKGIDAAIVTKHIQGFVRTNSSSVPYAGSHSHKSTGSIFFIERDGSKLELQSLYRSNKDHPSGVAVLGDGLFVAEGDFLRRFSVSAAGKDQKGPRFDLPKSEKSGYGLRNGGGGIGLAKLHDGTTLLIVSAPGGGFRPHVRKEAREDNAEPRHTRLYRFWPNAFAKDAKPVLVGEWTHPGTSSKPDGPGPYSENLSVVTECGSGRIYTIHTTGDYGLKGDGYWRLSRVEGDPKHPGLVHVATARQKQDNEACHQRSSATVHVNKAGELEFLCSERAAIKWHPSGRFDFKEGAR